MEIRYASRQDASALRAIWRVCFPDDTRAHVDWFFSERFSPDRALVLCLEKRIVSCLHLVQYRVKIRGKEYDAPFVVGAATLPEEQGKGLMRMLLQVVYEQLHSQGHALSMLYPFHYGFYRKLGFETVSRQCVYTLPLVDVKKMASSSFARTRREGLVEKPLDACSLKEVYDAMMSRFDTAMVRSSLLCYKRLDEWRRDGLLSILCSRGEKAEGYALFSLHEGHLTISELSYIDGAALLFLLDRLGAYAENEGIRSIKFPLPPRESIDFLLDDARNKAKFNPFAMLRVINVERFFDGLPLESIKSFTLRIKDEQCAWNNAVFEIFPGEHTRITRSHLEPQVQCAITTLAQLAAGSLGGNEAFALGLLEGDERVAKAFKVTGSYMFDMY